MTEYQPTREQQLRTIDNIIAVHESAIAHRQQHITRLREERVRVGAWTQEEKVEFRKSFDKKVDEGKIRQRALELQSQGPDEFPYGYYEHLAREEISGGKE